MDNCLKKLIAKENLSHDEMTDLMQSIMSGGLSPNYVSGILTALSIKERPLMKFLLRLKC